MSRRGTSCIFHTRQGMIGSHPSQRRGTQFGLVSGGREGAPRRRLHCRRGDAAAVARLRGENFREMNLSARCEHRTTSQGGIMTKWQHIAGERTRVSRRREPITHEPRGKESVQSIDYRSNRTFIEIDRPPVCLRVHVPRRNNLGPVVQLGRPQPRQVHIGEDSQV